MGAVSDAWYPFHVAPVGVRHVSHEWLDSVSDRHSQSVEHALRKARLTACAASSESAQRKLWSTRSSSSSGSRSGNGTRPSSSVVEAAGIDATIGATIVLLYGV